MIKEEKKLPKNIGSFYFNMIIERNKKYLREYVANINYFCEVAFEITSICNFNCIHCYNDQRSSDLEVKELYKTIDILKQLGVIYVTLTGGEPLLRKDFKEIYMYLKNHGFIINIFTNISMLENYKELFLNSPPKLISISLYGLDDTKHNLFTRTLGQFSRVKKNIEWIQKNNIDYEVKTIVNKHNYEDIIEEKYDVFFKRYNKKLLKSYEIFSTKNENKEVINHRISEEEVIKLLLNKNSKEKLEEYSNLSSLPPTNFECFAGKTFISVNSQCEFSICQRDFKNKFKHNIDNDNLIQKLMKRKKEVIEINLKRKCNHCKMNTLCSNICHLEEDEIKDGYICSIHHKMKRMSEIERNKTI